jgi:hypothetical protein
MPAGTAGLLPDRARVPSRIRVCTGFVALLALLPTAAFADDMIAGNLGGALAMAFALAAVPAVAAVAAFTVVVCLLEASLMDRFLKLGYRRCFWYAVVANLVSMGLGLIWYQAGGQVGWKTAMIQGEFGMVAWLLLRSFVITIAEEAVVVALLLRKRRDFETTIKAVLAANAASYALLGVITALIGVAIRS